MLRAILNKSWQQHPTRHQLYGHLPPITKTIQVRRTRHAGHCWRSRDELIRDVQKQDDQLERTFSSYVRIQNVVLKTYLGRWTIGKSGERGSGISVLPARYDDDDDDVPLARISLILSLHSSLSSIVLGKPSMLTPSISAQLYIGSSWSSNTCSSEWSGPLEYIALQFVLTSPLVSQVLFV